MKKLTDYLKIKHIKQRGFAEDIGISTSSLHEILRLGKIPTLKVAYEIEKFTEGHITLYDWVDQRLKIPKEKSDKDTKKTKNIE